MTQVSQTSGPLVLVTGGAGFIGSNLCRALLAHGYRVRVVDNFSTGRKETLRDLNRGRDAIDVREGDVRNLPALRKLVAGVDLVVHLAGLPSVAASVRDPVLSHAVNLEGTFNTLVAARDAKVKRFVYGSSAAVYGDRPEPLKHETLRPRPRSPLGAQVLAAEHYCRLFAELYGLATVCLRYFNVFGPGQEARGDHPAVVPALATGLLRGDETVVFGDGLQTRDFVYVEAAIEATLAALRLDAAVGRVLNVGSGTSVSIQELWTMLAGLVHKSTGQAVPAVPRHAPPRLGDLRHLRAATSRMRALLGTPAAPRLAEGLTRTVEALAKLPRTGSQSRPLPLPGSPAVASAAGSRSSSAVTPVSPLGTASAGLRPSGGPMSGRTRGGASGSNSRSISSNKRITTPGAADATQGQSPAGAGDEAGVHGGTP